MKHTLVEKIFARNVGHEVKPGDIITVNVDWCMVDDIMAFRGSCDDFVEEEFIRNIIN